MWYMPEPVEPVAMQIGDRVKLVDVIGQGWTVDTDEQCQELAELVLAGEWSISQRNWVHIEITQVDHA